MIRGAVQPAGSGSRLRLRQLAPVAWQPAPMAGGQRRDAPGSPPESKRPAPAPAEPSARLRAGTRRSRHAAAGQQVLCQPAAGLAASADAARQRAAAVACASSAAMSTRT